MRSLSDELIKPRIGADPVEARLARASGTAGIRHTASSFIASKLGTHRFVW
jgi:hypothetical protein